MQNKIKSCKKTCTICTKEFDRPYGCSSKKWNSRITCSNSCKNRKPFNESYKRGNVLYIKIKSLVAKCDLEDLEKIARRRWSNSHGYAFSASIYPKIFMHHLILGKPKNGKVTDHINGDRMDNRKCNLRHIEEKRNIRNKTVTNRYGEHGIYKLKHCYRVSIGVNYKNINVGYFNNLKDAKNARRLAEVHYWGYNIK